MFEKNRSSLLSGHCWREAWAPTVVNLLSRKPFTHCLATFVNSSGKALTVFVLLQYATERWAPPCPRTTMKENIAQENGAKAITLWNADLQQAIVPYSVPLC